jgi:hypothetical protein
MGQCSPEVHSGPGAFCSPQVSHRRECPPGRGRVEGLPRVAVEGVQHHGVGAEAAEVVEVVGDLVEGAHAGEPVAGVNR